MCLDCYARDVVADDSHTSNVILRAERARDEIDDNDYALMLIAAAMQDEEVTL